MCVTIGNKEHHFTFSNNDNYYKSDDKPDKFRSSEQANGALDTCKLRTKNK